jgi:hypothetical protein
MIWSNLTDHIINWYMMSCKCYKKKNDCSECHYNLRVARGSLRTCDHKTIDNCQICNICPIIGTYDAKCILCYDNPDIKSSCYECDKCKEDRKYLIETDSQFTLKSYGTFYGYTTELWHCYLCNYCIEIQSFMPGINRDIMHCIARKIHKQYICDDIIRSSY